MCRYLISLCILLSLTIIIAEPSYPAEKEVLIDFSSERIASSCEYTFAQSLLQKGISHASYESIIGEELKSPDARKVAIETFYKTYGFNKAVENSLYFFSRRIKERFTTFLSRSGRYISMMSEILKEKNLPHELVFLPLIESGFNPYALSPKKAHGLWQFIPSTAKRYGLKIDWWVDERRDPVKATLAATEYLSELYSMFGSWSLALAAYNAGEGKITRALGKAKTDNFWVLRNTKYIKKETKNYVPSYIAATAIAKDPEGFGFQDINYHEPMAYDEVTINSPMDIEIIARYAGVDVKEIRELNPELKRWCTPPNVLGYNLRIPANTKERFLANLSNAGDVKHFSVEHYTVNKGDTLKKIATRRGISVEVIRELNSLNKDSQLQAGSTILVPPKGIAPLTKDTERVKGKLEISKKKKSHKSKV